MRSIVWMIVMLFSLAFTLSSCSNDESSDDFVSGTVWVSEVSNDYIEFKNGTLYWGGAALEDDTWGNYSWKTLPGKKGWVYYTDQTFPYTVISSSTVMSFGSQLLEIRGNTMYRGDIVYKKVK